MRMTVLILFVLVLSMSSFGQSACGTYQQSSDTVGFQGTKLFSWLTLRSDGTFLYESRNSIGCTLWFDKIGHWRIEGDKLILTDNTQGVTITDGEGGKQIIRTTIYEKRSNELLFIKQEVNNKLYRPERDLGRSNFKT